jgi:cell division septal protein FtsQ
MPSRTERNRDKYLTNEEVKYFTKENKKVVKPKKKKPKKDKPKKTSPKKNKVKKTKINKKKQPKANETPKRRISFKKVFSFFFKLIVISTALYFILSTDFTVIYVNGNDQLLDQEILDYADIDKMNLTEYLISNLDKRLERNQYIESVDSKVGFLTLDINVSENYPLYYYSKEKVTVMKNLEVIDISSTPTVINYIPDTIKNEFDEAMQKVDIDILDRISEIRYEPDNVDEERFYLTMTDGNYVYLTLEKWSNINNYLKVIKQFPNSKGILYLNAGNSFEVKE